MQREAAKKVILNDSAIKEGVGGVKAVPLRQKELSKKNYFPTAKFGLLLSSSGVKALMALPLKNKLFMRLP